MEIESIEEFVLLLGIVLLILIFKISILIGVFLLIIVIELLVGS